MLYVQNVNKTKTDVVMVPIMCVKSVSLNVPAQIQGKSNGLSVHLRLHLRPDTVYAISERVYLGSYQPLLCVSAISFKISSAGSSVIRKIAL